MEVKTVNPQTALPGGTIRVEIKGLKDLLGLQVLVGGVTADIVTASTRLLTVRIPEEGGDGLTVSNGDQDTAPLKVGNIFASELPPVANPVVDSMGNVYVTYSGARGEKVSFGIFVVHSDGSKHPFLAEVVNPTGLAIGPDNCLYISSRHNGSIYRSTFDRQVEKYVDGLGMATGVVFDVEGNLLVGDRTGKIYRISSQHEISVLCELEPSVSAYHLAVAPDNTLFVTGPTLSTQDCVYAVSPEGRVQIYFKGFGRPQGIGFNAHGDLQVAASWRGRKGLYTLRKGVPELAVAGPMLVGFAYSMKNEILYLVDNANLFRIDLTEG